MFRSRLENTFPGLHVIGSLLVRSYLLIHDDEAVLIDSGLLWEPSTVKERLREEGLGLENLTTILLSHGHLDHTANLSWYRKHTNARLLAHPLEQIHIDGKFPYTKENRLCDWLKRAGRTLLRYQSVTADAPLTNAQELPLWGGLQVVHLPGHTAGHCGFYSIKHDLLLTGDLFASYPGRAALPPTGLNACPTKFPEAFTRIREINPAWVLPNHAWSLNPETISQQFTRLQERLQM